MKLILFLKKLFCTESLFYVGGSDDLPPPLSREEEAKAIAELISGSEEARRLLIERNLRLVVYIAKRFENTGVNLEDLTGIGAVGLIKAVNTFNSDKNIKLATYASREPPRRDIHIRAAQHGLGRKRAPSLRHSRHGRRLRF